ncbi:lipolytic enzyme, G-D-S-L [Paraglaciecola sp. T6c]|nr:lipolytic enzyme, G-D-S-L [Paraglaciecola sp. T6c]
MINSHMNILLLKIKLLGSQNQIERFSTVLKYMFISIGLVTLLFSYRVASMPRMLSSTAQLMSEDVLVFIGDSITHGGSYHQNIALFNATRFPQNHVFYVNGGISGDTALGTLRRFDRDIAPHRPAVATIMLGMNDVGRYLYETPAKDEAARIARDKEAAVIQTAYLTNMRKIMLRLNELGTKIVLLTPSIYDQSARVASANNYGVNDALQAFSGELTKVAKEFGAEVVDFQQPMLEVNAALQVNDPSATLVGADRVHPGEAGHFVMSYAFLEAQQANKYVANISIDVSRENLNVFENCALNGDLRTARDFVGFSCEAAALPFPVSKAQKQALQWVPFMDELNQQRLQIRGLKKGQYSLHIDQKFVGIFSHSLLSSGVNLAAIETTPMYQQALAVKAINDRRASTSRLLRDIAQVKYSMLDHYPDTDTSDLSAVSQVLLAHVEKSANEPWYGYLKKQVNTYLAEVDNETHYRDEVVSLHKKMYEVNKPGTHTYTLSFVGVE